MLLSSFVVVALAGEQDADLQRQMRLLGQRQVLVVLEEKSIEPSGQPAAVSTRGTSLALTEMLKHDGWVILDGTGRFKSATPTREEIDKVALELGADEILTGTVTMTRLKASRDGPIPDLNERGEQIAFFVRGEYALTLVDTGTWQKRINLRGNFPQNRMNEVQASQGYAQTELGFAKLAAPDMARELRSRMIEMLTAMEQNGVDVRVLVTGIDFDMATRLEERFSKVKNVKSAQLRGDFDEGRQAIEVRYRGTAQALAKELVALKGLRFEVTAVRSAFIELAAKK